MGQPPHQSGWGQYPGQDPHNQPTQIGGAQPPSASPYGQPQQPTQYGQPSYDQQQPYGQPSYGQQQPPPQYGQPAYGQPQQPPPYGYQQPPPHKSGGGKTVGVVLAIVAAVVVLGGGGTLVAYLAGAFEGSGSGGGPGGSARSPEQTVEQFWAAIQDRDCETALGLVSEKSWSEDGTLTREESLADCEESVLEDAPEDEEIPLIEDTTLVSEEGNTAVVDATMTIPEAGSQTIRHDLVREDGEWKIDEADLGL